MKTTIEDLLIDALERMDKARKLLVVRDDWQLLNTADIRNKLERLALANKAEGYTPSSAHSYTEGSGIEPKVKAPFVPCNRCDESGCTFNCIGKPKVKTTENNVINFLLGECPLDGYWYGDSRKGQSFWWRKSLREWADKNAVGPAVHPYPETLQSKLDDLSKAWKTFITECKEAVYPSTLTMEQKVAAARELWYLFIIEDCDGVDVYNFEHWLKKKKNGTL